MKAIILFIFFIGCGLANQNTQDSNTDNNVDNTETKDNPTSSRRSSSDKKRSFSDIMLVGGGRSSGGTRSRGSGTQPQSLTPAQVDQACRDTVDDVDFCSRTSQFRGRILNKFSGLACGDINLCHLESFNSLDLSGSYAYKGRTTQSCLNNIFKFNKDDFKGFNKLLSLDLSGNCLGGGSTFPQSGLNLRAKANEGIFSNLPKIKRIDLTDTGVDRLPKDFFTRDNLRTLDNKGVTVTAFLYCGSGQYLAPFISKLKAQSTDNSDFDWVLAHNAPHWQSQIPPITIPASDYCY